GGAGTVTIGTALPRRLPHRTERGGRPLVTHRRGPGRGDDRFRPDGLRITPGPVAHRLRPRVTACDDHRRTNRAAARRRTVVLALLATGLLLALASPWSGKSSPGLVTPGPALPTLSAHAVYTVRPGDSLWSIAERLDPAGDPRPIMAALARQAGGDTVRPGERLTLP
ncbi:MAG: LysM peptidoglycan-binding domain-containing protein, partial [Acidimicrobiales bacterium]